MTNADKVRNSLADNRILAAFLMAIGECDYCINRHNKKDCEHVSCINGILEWLKSEVNEQNEQMETKSW